MAFIGYEAPSFPSTNLLLKKRILVVWTILLFLELVGRKDIQPWLELHLISFLRSGMIPLAWRDARGKREHNMIINLYIVEDVLNDEKRLVSAKWGSEGEAELLGAEAGAIKVDGLQIMSSRGWQPLDFLDIEDGDTEREAIASLVLAMGLLDEIKVIQGMAPDHDLHG